MIPAGQIDEILESLDLSRAQPGVGFLEALFTRFNARVPFENATKILRDREIADPAAKPRTPEIFWADHLALGSGGTCFARVAAFDALLSALGFRTRRLLGRVGRDFDHAGLAVDTPAGEVLADVGFPLPGLIPAGAERVETSLAELAVERTERGMRVEWLDGVPDGPRALELFDAEVSAAEYDGALAPDVRAGVEVPDASLDAPRSRQPNRFLRGRGGARGRPALAPADAGRTGGRAGDALGSVWDRPGDPRAGPGVVRRRPTDPSRVDPDRLSRGDGLSRGSLLAHRAGRGLPRPGGEGRGGRVAGADGHRIPPDPASPGAPREAETAAVDEVSPEPSSLTIRLERRMRASASPARSSYAAQRRGGKTYLLRELRLEGSREDLLRNDSMRGRLAGSLALDLLAWARML